ncbi:hypothetical protein Tco_0837976 [Tanacetum coccineum]
MSSTLSWPVECSFANERQGGIPNYVSCRKDAKTTQLDWESGKPPLPILRRPSSVRRTQRQIAEESIRATGHGFNPIKAISRRRRWQSQEPISPGHHRSTRQWTSAWAMALWIIIHRSIRISEVVLRKAFRRNFMQCKKYSKNPVELARIRQRSYQELNDKVPPDFDELMRRRQGLSSVDWRKQRQIAVKRVRESPTKQRFRRAENRHNSPPNHDARMVGFAVEGAKWPSTTTDNTPAVALALMGNGFCDYHGEKGHSTDECIQLKKQIEKMVRAGRLALQSFVVITDQPIKQIISKPDAAGRLQKWSVLLGEHNISYRPRTVIKGGLNPLLSRQNLYCGQGRIKPAPERAKAILDEV